MSRLSDRSEPPKSQIGLIVFVLGTLAALLVLFPPWQSKEERQERMLERVMRKVEEAEGTAPALLERTRVIGEERLNLKVVSAKIPKLQDLLTRFYERAPAILAEIDADNPDSPLAEINRQAGKKPVAVEKGLFDLLSWCVEIAGRTEGYFDPTLRPYYELWRFDVEKPLMADPQVLKSRIPLVGYAQLELDPEALTVYLSKEGAGLDLRMLRNGLVLRELARELEADGFEDYFAFLGTDSIARGVNLAGEPWVVAVQHPRKTLHYHAQVKPGSRAVMVATDYEKVFVQDAVWYHMYLDPYSGIPEQSSSSVAVIGPDPLLADVLAFALFAMGPKRAVTMIENFPDYAVVMMDRFDQAQVAPEGLEHIVLGEGQNF